eukprot:183911-Lingulodinium_polyedra.AAC.1
MPRWRNRGQVWLKGGHWLAFWLRRCCAARSMWSGGACAPDRATSHTTFCTGRVEKGAAAAAHPALHLCAVAAAAQASASSPPTSASSTSPRFSSPEVRVRGALAGVLAPP